MGARNRQSRNRVVVYRPARLHRLAELIPWNRFLGSSKVKKFRAGIFKESMGARNRGGIGLSYRPARLHRLVEFIPWYRFLGSMNFKKYSPYLLTFMEPQESIPRIPTYRVAVPVHQTGIDSWAPAQAQSWYF
jgi:hypothetical protein